MGRITFSLLHPHQKPQLRRATWWSQMVLSLQCCGQVRHRVCSLTSGWASSLSTMDITTTSGGRQDQGYLWALVTMKVTTDINMAPGHIRAFNLNCPAATGAMALTWPKMACIRMAPWDNKTPWHHQVTQPAYIHMDLMLHPILGGRSMDDSYQCYLQWLCRPQWSFFLIQSKMWNSFISSFYLFPEAGLSCSLEAESGAESESA